VEQALHALGRIVPAAAAIVRGLRVVALLCLAAAAVTAIALFQDGVPEPAGRAIASVALAVGVAVPGIVLFLFHRALAEVVQLPERLRSTPRTGREHADELAALVRNREQPRRLPLRAWRLFALGRSSRSLLTPYAPLVALLSKGFLLAAGLSTLAAPLVLLIGLVALVSLA
jgi:hypothetical protein